jgi:hypothetical protein
MSTLNVSNITDGVDTVGTSYVLNGSAKAWVLGSSTTTITDSLNVSSVTDTNTGRYSYSFTSSFSSGDYGVSGSVDVVGRIFSGNGFNYTKDASTSPMAILTWNDVYEDRVHTMKAIGDLA